MKKKFNITGLCIPEKHYMADVSDKVNKIATMIQEGNYFAINRARQYGKTTIFYLLYKKFREDYLVIQISLEGMDELFVNYKVFADGVAALITKRLEQNQISKNECLKFAEEIDEEKPFHDLSRRITELVVTSKRPVILLIDEVDKSADNQIFLAFLGMLRNKYLDMQAGLDQSFLSVVLAGVYDIKNLKGRIRPEEERKYNSPWNIAVDFNIDMSLSKAEIVSMLEDYEKDYNTGMDIGEIAKLLRDYTSGYPFLVSKLCKEVEESYHQNWTGDAVRAAVKTLLFGTNTLFDDLIKNIENDKKFAFLVEEVIFSSELVPFRISNPLISKGVMFGIFSERDGYVVVSNKIFEMYIYEYFISINRPMKGKMPYYEYIKDGRLDMETVVCMFQNTMKKMEGNVDDFEQFVESQGRLLLVAFLTPILNGSGHYVIESWAKDRTRMDIQIFYGKQEEIIELKIWHGKKKEEEAYNQLTRYMESRGCRQGYLINFCFLKKKQYQAEWIEWNGYKIFEVIV